MAPHERADVTGRDAARLNALVLDGLLPMQFTYPQVTLEPAWVLELVRVALGRAAA